MSNQETTPVKMRDEAGEQVRIKFMQSNLMQSNLMEYLQGK